MNRINLDEAGNDPYFRSTTVAVPRSASPVPRARTDEESSIGSNESEETVSESNRRSRLLLAKLGFWERFLGKGRKKVSWVQSLKAVATYSWLNGLLIFLPIAWAVHGAKAAGHPISHTVVFGLCFITLIPLSKLLDYAGEQMALYCGKDLGDLIVITLNNSIEAALAVFLLAKGELRLLQATIIGVILLRLLLIPGLAFITGGARVMEQELHPVNTELNHTLLVTGSLTLLLPVAFFCALDRGDTGIVSTVHAAVSDEMRGQILKISRGLALILLGVYICSRFFVHIPPGEDASVHKDAPAEFVQKMEHLEHEEAEMNQWSCLIVLLVAVIFMVVTTEYLVESIDPMQKKLGIKEEWFGLVLLPIVSFSADGILSAVYFVRLTLKHYLGTPYNPQTLAEARAIDLSIQFLMFWTPMLVIAGWMTHKPMSLLFDLFEISVLLGSCFLVNYVTADSRTNWAEGSMLVAFYIMIALTAWFYPGQQEVHLMLSPSISVALAAHGNHSTGSTLATHAPADVPHDAKVQTTLAAKEKDTDATLSPKLVALINKYLKEQTDVSVVINDADDDEDLS